MATRYVCDRCLTEIDGDHWRVHIDSYSTGKVDWAERRMVDLCVGCYGATIKTLAERKGR